MEQASNIASSALSSGSSRPSETGTQVNPRRLPLAQILADELWLRMAARYGHGWVGQYGARPDGLVGAEWRQTLGDLSRSEMLAGCAADIGRGAEWPPSSPAFLRMCLGIPTVAQIRRAFARRRRFHAIESPFARLVASFLDWWIYQQADTRTGTKMLDAAYNEALVFRLRGAELPPALPLGYDPPPGARRAVADTVAIASLATVRAKLAASATPRA